MIDPFDELLQYCSTFNLATLDSRDHSHVPYIVLLIQSLELWRLGHEGKLPSTTVEKKDFKELIRGLSRGGIDGADIEHNFEEAMKEASRAYISPTVPVDILETVTKKANGSHATEFEVLVSALDLFMKEPCNKGMPPLGGQLPDMTSTTDFFVALQQVFQMRGASDRVMMKEKIRSVLESKISTGLPPGQAQALGIALNDEVIDRFCKNLFNLRVIHTRSITEERAHPNTAAIEEALSDPYEDPAQTPILWYIALRAVDRFLQKFGRYPGTSLEGDPAEFEVIIDRDAEAVWTEMQNLVVEYKRCRAERGYGAMDVSDEVTAAECADQYQDLSRSHAAEITRVGASELHNIAALIGGVASQEAVKIITHQFVPLNNTFVFNGITGIGGTYEL